MDNFTLDDVPLSVLADVNRHAPVECRKCGISYSVLFQPPVAVVDEPEEE